MGNYKIAIIGGIGHAEKFAGIIKDSGSEVVAVWDHKEARGKELAAKLACSFEPDYDKLLSSYNLDGVVIIAENVFKKEFVIKAAQAGKHIFLEKPLTIDPKDAREMQRAVHENDVTFYMSDPFVRRGTIQLRQLIDSGKLGTITGAHIRLGDFIALLAKQLGLKDTPLYDKSLTLGGIMADTGVHMLHVMYYLFGKPSEVCAAFHSVMDESKANDTEDCAAAIFRYPDGKLVTFEATYVSSASSHAIDVFGTKGCVWIKESMDRQNGEDQLIFRSGLDTEEIYGNDALPPNPTQHINYWLKMLEEHIPNDMVGVDPMSNSGVSIDHAVELVDIVDAIYISAASGAFVKIL